MAALTPFEEKSGEVWGLAQAAPAARLTFAERLATVRRRRRSDSARAVVQVLTWITAGFGLALLAILIETGH